MSSSFYTKAWVDFCKQHQVFENAVPLFAMEGDRVALETRVRTTKKLLHRSQEMESLVIQEAAKVCDDYDQKTEEYEGLLYLMLWREDQEVLPLYFGKTEKYGKKNKNLSDNLRGVPEGHNKSNFCRWGHNYAYHIGDLSAVVCPSHPEKHKTPKYQRWADQLFADTTSRRLKQTVWFWTKAWSKTDSVSVEVYGGPTALSASEYQLIGIGSTLYPDTILNMEGVNR